MINIPETCQPASITLKPKREKSLLYRHPWVFSGAISRVDGQPRPGDTVDVFAGDGRWLARGAYSPQSQIRVRVWSFDQGEAIDPLFFQKRLRQALGLRRQILADADTNACRLVCGESDGLPGLIVDRYDHWVVGQFLSAGTERWKSIIVECLDDLVPGLLGIYERSDVDIRKKEGLALATGHLSGAEPPDMVDIQENSCRYRVDLKGGHKTGFYLDQRDNRACVAAYAKGADMLNCFAYTGGFAVAALKAGASHVVNVDSSATALEMSRTHVALNELDSARVDHVTGDVFSLLRRYHTDGRTFDVVVLDPPKFVNAKGDLMRASRGYKDISRLAFELLRPGGTLFTFSCSGLMGRDLFQKIVADAALDAGRQAVILQWLSQAPDHPTALNFPEGSYLKGLVCRVV
jgi:23S rRNA (cytosine1962-C5)-methyltransferase